MLSLRYKGNNLYCGFNVLFFLKVLHNLAKLDTDLFLTYSSAGCDRCTVGGYHGNG